LKKPYMKKGWGMAQSAGPEFKLQCKKKDKT
jgi:hypothetical protein